MELKRGSVVGHFELRERIGAGGMGVVFRARDSRLARDVALKALSPRLFEDRVARTRFLREAQLAASITHPNVATIHEVDEIDGGLFIAMELVEGRDLKDVVSTGPLALDEVISIGRQVCAALEAAHTNGVIHRDVKSSNIVMTAEGQVKVLDFGLAKALGEATGERAENRTPPKPLPSEPDFASATSRGATEDGEALGTPSYMSPEQASGQAADHRSDIFSLGVVLYELACGELPFRGASQEEILKAIRITEPTPVHVTRPGVPGGLSRVISKCLEKNPAKRYHSVAALRDDLERTARHSLSFQLRSGLNRIRGFHLPRKALWRPVVLSTLAVGLVAVGAALSRMDEILGIEMFRESDARNVLIVPFENTTGDPELNGILDKVLAAQLDQSSQFSVLSDRAVEELLRQMGLPEVPARMDSELSREVCLRGAVPVLISGEIDRVDAQLVLTTRLWRVSNNEAIATFQERVPDKRGILDAVDRVAASIRSRAGEALAGTQATQVPTRLWTSSSWEALQLYSQSIDRQRLGDSRAAVGLLERATELDPAFAMAHARMGRIFDLLGDRPSSYRAFERAMMHVDRLTPKERGLVKIYYYLATDQSEALLAEAQRLSSLHRQDPDVQLALGWGLSLAGDNVSSVASMERAIALSPPSPSLHYNFANRFLLLGEYQRARAEVAQIVRLHPDYDQVQYTIGYLNLLEGNRREALREFEKYASSDDPLRKGRGLFHLAIAHIYFGDDGVAERLLEERIRFGRLQRQPSVEAESLLLLARLSLENGASSSVRSLVEQSLELGALDHRGFALAGELLARTGFPDEAISVLDRLRQIDRDGNSATVERLSEQLRGEVALARGHIDEALRLQRGAVDLASHPPWSEPLARTYRKAGDAASAAREYERILEHKGPVFLRSGLWGPPLFTEARDWAAELRGIGAPSGLAAR